MAKIKIKGCGKCLKNKGCEIKKKYREFGKTLPESRRIGSLPFRYEVPYTLDIDCPFKTPLYKEGDKVEFTVGIGEYIKKTEWECDFSYFGDQDPCQGCGNKSICNDGIVTFENTRYKDYVKVKGEILNQYTSNKWVIDVDEDEYNKILPLMNKRDIEKHQEICNVFDPGQYCYMVFVSRDKFIKKI